MLRPWREADYQDLYEYAKNPLVGPQAGWPVHESAEESREIARGFAEEKRDLILALEHKQDAKVIGSIGLHDRQVSLAYEQLASREMGYVLSPEMLGAGADARSGDVHFGIWVLSDGAGIWSGAGISRGMKNLAE